MNLGCQFSNLCTYSSHVFTNPEFSIYNCFFNNSVILAFYNLFWFLNANPFRTDHRKQKNSWKKLRFCTFRIRENMWWTHNRTGKYLTHCNGVNVPQSITAYENVLAKICGGKVFYSKTKCYVKSFFETWVFYQLSRRDWLLIRNQNFWMII